MSVPKASSRGSGGAEVLVEIQLGQVLARVLVDLLAVVVGLVRHEQRVEAGGRGNRLEERAVGLVLRQLLLAVRTTLRIVRLLLMCQHT